MSQTRSDTAFRNTRPQAKDLSAPHLRALRKELLLVRADVERMEFAQATIELRQAVKHFSWLKFILPGFGGLRMGRGSKANFLNAGSIGALLKQYPFVSSVASLLLAKPLRATLAAGAKPALKWGSLALAGWEAYRIWKQIKKDSAASADSEEAAADSGY
ncbi:hypothetical protein DSC91_005947 [Paraburkholderia caffeinilytica]|jgi:uncharacterized protein DUF3318|uniref:DUF3318 domain-containing protein n=1 Tax=Paraburkholderia caffeinilytica TaxID=1761016 RepID=A0ABQ1N887_9BURK|nr:DUF3318 domain-containing protein [Paraburkholderia caffeinilytica]AXL52792.1 hypothetical protein DSC91_005947 [Paraburkholderia caffeinilytica]GGC59313.1 hypothetical protein GCM10011400_53870 [Paraburkholderia caffeinilytica]CAB3803274.1 hypothetical protein LMG28690_05766 [Paraburkholderia caffeinilytica]